MTFLGDLFAKNSKTEGSISNSLDMVTRAASLASNDRNIDLILDDVRMVTAKLQPGQPISDADNKKHIRAYLQIEKYLITEESLRTFTKEGLRRKYTDDLRQYVDACEAAYGAATNVPADNASSH